MVVLSISTELLEYSDKVNDKYVTKYILKSSKGIEVTLLSYGATILSLKTVNKFNELEEITLNYNTFDEYKEFSTRFFGSTVGRVANRIKNGKEGFDKKNWQSNVEITTDHIKVIFTYISVDGEENYPGELNVKVTYTLDKNNDLSINYEATTNKKTAVNLTNHTYWNLSGNLKDKVYDHRLLLSCDYYLPVDSTLIPTGELRIVSDSRSPEFNLLSTNSSNQLGKRLGDVIPLIIGGVKPGYDHCFVVNREEHEVLPHVATLTDVKSGRQLILHSTQPGELRIVSDSRSPEFNLLSTNSSNQLGKRLGDVIPLIIGGVKPGYDHCFVVNREEHEVLPHVATLTDVKSGRQLILHSTQPGVQVYTANWLSDNSDDYPFIQHNAICLETQHFPDAINHPNFPRVLLSPNEVYKHTSRFSFRLIG
eukprot:gene20358-26423_t